ncbi:MAG: hypothetical protein ACOC2Y_04500 [Spirochaetota bacterium]
MISTYGKFVRLLKLEIESLHDEVEIILQSLDARLANHEITDYVRNENGAVLRNELLGLEDILCTELDLEDRDQASVDEIAEAARACIKRRMKERDYVPALYDLVDGRIAKIVTYLRSPVAAR